MSTICLPVLRKKRCRFGGEKSLCDFVFGTPCNLATLTALLLVTPYVFRFLIQTRKLVKRKSAYQLSIKSVKSRLAWKLLSFVFPVKFYLLRRQVSCMPVKKPVWHIIKRFVYRSSYKLKRNVEEFFLKEP